MLGSTPTLHNTSVSSMHLCALALQTEQNVGAQISNAYKHQHTCNYIVPAGFFSFVLGFF